MKNKRGITLIALVITIILMLILAGITINFALGNNGIIKKAIYAKELYEQAGRNEQESLENLWGELAKEPTIPESSRDTTLPTASITISGNTTQDSLPIRLNAIVKQEDIGSGVKIESCKYIVNTQSEEIGLEEESYTSGMFTSEEEAISFELTTTDNWYIHVLTVDNENNKTETIKGPITIVSEYHVHKDVNEANQAETYQASTRGGCFTTEQHTYETITTRCTGTYTILRTEDGNHPGSKGLYNCNAYCGWYGNQGKQCENPNRLQQVVTGTYYTVACGKTTETIDAYTVNY